MALVAYGNRYEDVFVFENIVYAMACELRVVHVYRNRNNSLIKLHDVRHPCGCNHFSLSHSIIVTNEHIIQYCPNGKILCILDRSGELLRKVFIADISGQWPILYQVDVDGNFLLAHRWTNRFLIAHANQPRSQWRVVNLPELSFFDQCVGALWFRHRLHVTDLRGRVITFTPVDETSS